MPLVCASAFDAVGETPPFQADRSVTLVNIYLETRVFVLVKRYD